MKLLNLNMYFFLPCSGRASTGVVVECYHIAGMFDYLLKVVVKDMETYQDFVANKLAGLENIRKVQSAFMMSEIKHSTRLYLK